MTIDPLLGCFKFLNFCFFFVSINISSSVQPKKMQINLKICNGCPNSKKAQIYYYYCNVSKDFKKNYWRFKIKMVNDIILRCENLFVKMGSGRLHKSNIWKLPLKQNGQLEFWKWMEQLQILIKLLQLCNALVAGNSQVFWYSTFFSVAF